MCVIHPFLTGVGDDDLDHTRVHRRETRGGAQGHAAVQRVLVVVEVHGPSVLESAELVELVGEGIGRRGVGLDLLRPSLVFCFV